MILRVYRPEIDEVDDFDDPATLARASEGFCPFAYHFSGEDQIGTEESVAVVLQPDGTVLCPFKRTARDQGTIMRFEWLAEATPIL